MLNTATSGLWPDQLLNLTNMQWTLILSIVFIAGLMLGLGGFGFGLVTTPALLWVLPIPYIAVANLSLSIILRLPFIYADKLHIKRDITRDLILGGLVGLPIGVLLLNTLNQSDLKLYASVIIMFLGVPYLIQPERIPQWRYQIRICTGGAGLVSGALATSVSLSGPPVVLWLLNQRLTGRKYRGTVSWVLPNLNLAAVIMLVLSRTAPVASLLLPLILLPIAAVGSFCGNRLFRYLPVPFFTRLIAGLVIISGLVGVWNTF